ncbi:hypothetical protein CHS0354_030268 [Potamilus streckersoni]|uniref:Tyrosine-protein phosphatase domain-containing protein n=1 Tax=Potamilus streckersoni TaxID=2493646 RepID=A0AAE0SY63_9BIVA|nr:hypothetical protein CHS0354_030268 [Potamilus streckersoni]
MGAFLHKSLSEIIQTASNDLTQMNYKENPNGRTKKSLKTSKVALETTSGNTFQMTKFQIIKNMLVLILGLWILFTSFNSLSNLQSSLNREEGLGTIRLSVIYAAQIVFCMFLPPVTIARLGCKWTVAISMLCYIAYIAANFYATWVTIIPAAIILGLGAALLWSASCTYLTQAGFWYAKMTGRTEDDTINRFFAVFFFIFPSSQMIADILSMMVFRQIPANYRREEKCPANYDPRIVVDNTNLDTPDNDNIYRVCGICIACAAVAFLIIVIFLDRIVLDKYDDKEAKKICPHLLVETIKHCWGNHYQKLLIFLTFYSGIAQAFIAGDFTVSCVKGVWNVSFVTFGYMVVEAVYVLICRRLWPRMGYIPIFVLAFIIHGGCQIAMLNWLRHPDVMSFFYILATLWRMGDGVIQAQINALTGFLFTKNTVAAFTNYRLFESIGFITAFGYDSYLITRVKLYLCLVFLCVGMFFYGVIEVVYRRSAAEKSNDDPQAKVQTDENYSRINGTEDIPLEIQPNTEGTPEKHCVAIGNYLQFYNRLMEANLSSGKLNFLHSFEDYLTRMNRDQTSIQYDYSTSISDDPVNMDVVDAMDIYHLGEKGRICMVTATSVMTLNFWNNVVDNNITTIVDLDVEGDVDLNEITNISFKQVKVLGVHETFLSGIRFVKLQLISGNKDRSVLYIAATFKPDEELLVNATKLAIIYIHGVRATSESAGQNVLIHIKATSSGKHGIVYGVFSVLHHLDETGFFDLDESLKRAREKNIFEVDTFEKFRLLHDAARLFVLNHEGKENVSGTQI